MTNASSYPIFLPKAVDNGALHSSFNTVQVVMKNRLIRRPRSEASLRPLPLLRPQRRLGVCPFKRCPTPVSCDQRLRDLLTQATDVLRSQTELIRQSEFCVPLSGGALKGLGHILQNVQELLVDAYVLYDERLRGPEDAGVPHGENLNNPASS